MALGQDIRTSGAVLSTNAQIKVNCGFQPAMVKLLNIETVAVGEWWAGMPQNAMISKSGASNVNTVYVTTSGIKLFSDSTGEGFTIEPGAPINPTGSNQIIWAALRGTGPTLKGAK